MNRNLGIGVGFLFALVLVWLLVAALFSAAGIAVGIQTGAFVPADAGARLAVLAV